MKTVILDNGFRSEDVPTILDEVTRIMEKTNDIAAIDYNIYDEVVEYTEEGVVYWSINEIVRHSDETIKEVILKRA